MNALATKARYVYLQLIRKLALNSVTRVFNFEFQMQKFGQRSAREVVQVQDICVRKRHNGTSFIEPRQRSIHIEFGQRCTKLDIPLANLSFSCLNPCKMYASVFIACMIVGITLAARGNLGVRRWHYVGFVEFQRWQEIARVLTPAVRTCMCQDDVPFSGSPNMLCTDKPISRTRQSYKCLIVASMFVEMNSRTRKLVWSPLQCTHAYCFQGTSYTLAEATQQVLQVPHLVQKKPQSKFK